MRIAPFRGEFGLKLAYHVPAVYALGRGHTIGVEPGEEALYPLADEWRVVGRRHDDERHGNADSLRAEGVHVRGDLGGPRFVPEPHVRQGVTADVVICPRKRRYGSAKNWPHWQRLVELPGVFAAGAPDSSDDVDCPRAWDYGRFLDASIEAMRSARLVIATDAGLAHLAVLCGAPLLLITHGGRVAPGPVVDADGRILEPEYWPVRMERYRAGNHTGSTIVLIDGWEHPARVVEAARGILG